MNTDVPPPYPGNETSPLLGQPIAVPVPSQPMMGTEGDGAYIAKPNAKGHITIACRVCGTPINYIPGPKVNLAKCSNCNECTQVGPPPPGKQFIVCPCNALLTTNVSARAVVCPRPHCKRTTILKPPEPGKQRAFCAHCNTLLSYSWSAAVVICPKCRHRSVVNRSRLRGYAFSFFIIGFLLLFIGIGVTVATLVAAEYSYGGGFYVVMYGPIIVGVVTLIRGLIYAITNCSAPDASYIGV